MILCNFSNTTYNLGWYQGLWQNLEAYLSKHKIEGIELLLHGNDDISAIPEGLVQGLHLSYFPTWLDFYRGNEAYKKDFPEKEDVIKAYGGETKEALVRRYKKEFEIAKTLDVKYVVFHVAHVTLEHAFSFDYTYTNIEVIDAVIDLVNQVFVGDSNVSLLFENLWWPGMTLLSEEETIYLMERISYKKKGIMLDLSHLLITNTEISNYLEATAYVMTCLKNLGCAKSYIKGVHMNATFVSDYLSVCHVSKYDAYINEGESYKKMDILYGHISQLDAHKPYACYSINEILDYIKPEFKVIEVVASDKLQWQSLVEEQLKYLEV